MVVEGFWVVGSGFGFKKILGPFGGFLERFGGPKWVFVVFTF